MKISELLLLGMTMRVLYTIIMSNYRSVYNRETSGTNQPNCFSISNERARVLIRASYFTSDSLNVLIVLRENCRHDPDFSSFFIKYLR